MLQEHDHDGHNYTQAANALEERKDYWCVDQPQLLNWHRLQTTFTHGKLQRATGYNDDSQEGKWYEMALHEEVVVGEDLVLHEHAAEFADAP